MSYYSIPKHIRRYWESKMPQPKCWRCQDHGTVTEYFESQTASDATTRPCPLGCESSKKYRNSVAPVQ